MCNRNYSPKPWKKSLQNLKKRTFNAKRAGLKNLPCTAYDDLWCEFDHFGHTRAILVEVGAQGNGGTQFMPDGVICEARRTDISIVTRIQNIFRGGI
jgi:hypothetical protein